MRSLGTWVYRYCLRTILIIFHLFLKIFKLFPRREIRSGPVTIIATGTFYSDHWLTTHLQPMALANNCDKIIMVSCVPVPNMKKVEGVCAPLMMTRIFGQVPARLLYFSWLVITKKPDVVLGFHLLLNGLFTVLLGKLTGSKSIYICGGGQREVAGGGIQTENRVFNRIGQADKFIELLLLKAVNEMDLVITMGTGAADYFAKNGVSGPFEIVPGGFDDNIFTMNKNESTQYDFILIGRLSAVKCVDRFLNALNIAKQSDEHISAVIVGDGPDKMALENYAIELGLEHNVEFVGWQDNVDVWIKKSKCFVLTSDSEGLSQALIQAMMCGKPAVVSNVGDLSDIIVSKENGFLVDELVPKNFATCFTDILTNKQNLPNLSSRAYRDTTKFAIPQVAQTWQRIFYDVLKFER